MTDHITEAADRAEQRAARSAQRAAEGMQDAADLSQEMADAGLISQEAAAETAQIAERFRAKVDREHNSATVFAKDQLRAIVERVEYLETEKAGIASDIKDVYAEA